MTLISIRSSRFEQLILICAKEEVECLHNALKLGYHARCSNTAKSSCYHPITSHLCWNGRNVLLVCRTMHLVCRHFCLNDKISIYLSDWCTWSKWRYYFSVLSCYTAVISKDTGREDVMWQSCLLLVFACGWSWDVSSRKFVGEQFKIFWSC